MNNERQRVLNDVVEELRGWSFERLVGLRSERLSRQVVLEGGRSATVHAEPLEEYLEGDVTKALIPVELWIENEVVWLHLIARSDDAHEVSLELHGNPHT